LINFSFIHGGAKCLNLLAIVGVSVMCSVTDGYSQKIEKPSSKDSVRDEFDIKNSSFLLPLPLPAGHYQHALAIRNVVVPKDWALDNIQAPFINYSAKYTLPRGFNLQGNLSTLFISNQLASVLFGITPSIIIISG